MRVDAVLHFERFMEARLRAATDAFFRIAEANLAQVRICHELLSGPCTPGWLSWRLGIDPGYMSRTLSLMALEGWITLRESPTDRRQRLADYGSRRLVRATKVVIEVFERDDMTNLVERIREDT